MATPPETQATTPKRELAAIMFSDIAGYTAIMGRDEERAMCSRCKTRWPLAIAREINVS